MGRSSVHVEKVIIISIITGLLVTLAGCSGCRSQNKKQLNQEMLSTNIDYTETDAAQEETEDINSSISAIRDDEENYLDTEDDVPLGLKKEGEYQEQQITKSVEEREDTQAQTQTHTSSTQTPSAEVTDEDISGANGDIITNRDEYVKVEADLMEKGIILPYENMDPNFDTQGGNCPYPLMVMTMRTYYNGWGQCADYPGMYYTEEQEGEAGDIAVMWAIQNGQGVMRMRIGVYDDVGSVYFAFYGMN